METGVVVQDRFEHPVDLGIAGGIWRIFRPSSQSGIRGVDHSRNGIVRPLEVCDTVSQTPIASMKTSAVFIPAETHRSQMRYRSLCRFLMAAKAVASGR